MLILPDRNIPRSKVLMPMLPREWRTSSQAQPKNTFGHENQTRFCATARLNDGHIVWRGWFDDRDDFDQFIWAIASGSIDADKFVQRLSTPWWNPDLREYPALSYDFVTTVFLTSGSTWLVPADYINIGGPSAFVDTIGAGASGGAGGAGAGASGTGGGGGAGAWSRYASPPISVTPGATINIQVGVGGAARTSSGVTGFAGVTGTDTWFNGTSLAVATVGATGGTGGQISVALGNVTAAAGGLASARPNTANTTGFNGGSGGPSSGSTQLSKGTGGGGAGGFNGAGNNAPNNAASSTGTNGASADAGFGGAAGTGSATASTAGGTGTEYDATHGSGGGAGGWGSSTVNPTAAGGGLYGGGGGGAGATGAGQVSVSGRGGDGLIAVAYAPFTPLLCDLPDITFMMLRKYRTVAY